MKLTKKKFWIYEVATALCLSAFSLTFYSDNVSCIILILLSNALAVAIGLLWSKNIGVLYTWLLIWGAAVGAYLVDVTLMVIFNMTIHEPYPLIVFQVYLLPIIIFINGAICAACWVVMSKAYKRICLRKIFLFLIVGVLIVLCVVFDPFSSNRSNEWKANGLVGNVTDLYIYDDGKGIAISSLRHMNHPDTATVYLTENGGRKWDLFIELPGYDKTFNTVRINDDVYCVIQHRSAYEIERINHEGSNWWSDYKFAKPPILFVDNDSLCFAANGIFYRTDRRLDNTDPIGCYSLRPANDGLAVVQNHIFGFTFDRTLNTYRLYDFTSDSYIADFSCKGYVSLIKSSDNTCVILTQTEGEVESYLLDCSTGTMTKTGQFDFGMMEALRSEGGVIYSLVTKRPNTDSYILYSLDAGKTWNTHSINESHIRAYCIHNGYLYFYNQFMHTICRQKLEKEDM